MTKKEMLEGGIYMLENWLQDNILKASDDEVREVIKDIEKMKQELKKESEEK